MESGKRLALNSARPLAVFQRSRAALFSRWKPQGLLDAAVEVAKARDGLLDEILSSP